MSAPAVRTIPSARVTTWLEQRPAMVALRRAAEARSKYREHFTSLFWPVTVISFVVVLLTGVALLPFYDPSTDPVTYDGSYAPLFGAEMSRALASTLDLSFEVPGGLLLRQVHSWATSLMIAALMVHILQLFFTNGYRGSRKWTWALLFVVLFLAMGAGLTGVVLPDDLVSGSSLAVLDGVLKAVPVVGTWLSALVFGRGGPSGAIDTFYPLHVFALPVTMVALVVLVVMRMVRAEPLHFPGARPARPARAGRSALRTLVLRRLALGGLVAGILVLLGATVTINPVWLYGPADPGNASAGHSAVWYLAFLDGAQRLVPPGWEFVWLDRTWTLAILIPVGGVGLFFAAAVLYPFVEGWVSIDGRRPDLLDRPRAVPNRTAIGVAGMVFYGVLWAAAASDVIATQFGLDLEAVVIALQVLLVFAPVAALVVTRRICLGLQGKDRDIVLHGHETGRIVRMPGGDYVQRHKPPSCEELEVLTAPAAVGAHTLRPGSDGWAGIVFASRVVLGRLLFSGAQNEGRPVQWS